jgi:hypothetical protein
MLQKIYEQVECWVRVNGHYTENFDSIKGVKQGEPLSPLLVLLFINDMQHCIYDNTIDSFCIGEIRMYLLLFADDTVLMSSSRDGLQNILNNLYAYCTDWEISVNIDKTVVMVFKKGNIPENIDLFYDNCRLNIVTKFTYLGVTLYTIF